VQFGTERTWLDLKVKRSKVKVTAMSKDIDCDVYSWVMRATGESREELDTAADDERTTVA